jgi:RNA polymerase sigma factor (sigma-70 family)
MNPGRDSLLEQSFTLAQKVAARRLPRSLRRLLDPDDVAAEVIILLAPKVGQYGPDLPRVAVRVTELWIIDACRRSRALKRDIRREHHPDQFLLLLLPDPAAEGRAHDDLVAAEARETIIRGLTGPQRTIVRMKERGKSNEEAARVVGWGTRRVQRFLERLRIQLGLGP